MSASRLLSKLIRLYQLTISPLLPGHCRFYPSCSQYAIEAIHKKGARKGVVMAVARVLRCHPWSAGGIEEVK